MSLYLSFKQRPPSTGVVRTMLHTRAFTTASESARISRRVDATHRDHKNSLQTYRTGILLDESAILDLYATDLGTVRVSTEGMNYSLTVREHKRTRI